MNRQNTIAGSDTACAVNSRATCLSSSGIANSDWGPRTKDIRLNEVTSEHFMAEIEAVARTKPGFFMRPKVHTAHEIEHTTCLLGALAL